MFIWCGNVLEHSGLMIFYLSPNKFSEGRGFKLLKGVNIDEGGFVSSFPNSILQVLPSYLQLKEMKFSIKSGVIIFKLLDLRTNHLHPRRMMSIELWKLLVLFVTPWR